MLSRTRSLAAKQWCRHSVAVRRFSTNVEPRRVWVMTDGGIQSTLSGLALGKRLSGDGTECHVKTMVASKSLSLFPAIIQKYLVDWSLKRSSGSTWYLERKEKDANDLEGPAPDYVICSAPNAIPAALTVAGRSSNAYLVYVGFPNIPFLYFDQVVLPAYEANAKLAKLGPYARQKNAIATTAPLLSTEMPNEVPLTRSLVEPLSASFTAVVVGGYSPQCRWYSEDANLLIDNMRRMVHHLHAKVIVVLTDRTTDAVKGKIKKALETLENVTIWDAMAESNSSLERVQIYENIIHHAARVVLTADLDYAVAHAAAKRKPVYVAFGDRCRSHLLHFHRWTREKHITRKLRLDRSRSSSLRQPYHDPYSYLGEHPAWADGQKVLRVQENLEYVAHELDALRQEKMTGKRRQP